MSVGNPYLICFGNFLYVRPYVINIHPISLSLPLIFNVFLYLIFASAEDTNPQRYDVKNYNKIFHILLISENYRLIN